MMKQILLLALSLLCSFMTFAQDTAASPEVPMMHEHGKLYVVVGVILLIFIGIVFYLVRLEKKLNQVEKKIKEKK